MSKKLLACLRPSFLVFFYCLCCTAAQSVTVNVSLILTVFVCCLMVSWILMEVKSL